MRFLILVFFLMGGSPAPSEPPATFEEPTYASSFDAAKKSAADIYDDHQETLYCGCPYERTTASGGQVEHEPCGFENRPGISDLRANRIEWEHIVPASLMPARQHQCWIEGGRSNCERNGPPHIKAMIFDLHNLAPSVGQVNADRSNKRYGIIEGEERVFGACDFEYEGALDLAEPADQIRGDVARVWLYMKDTHGVEFAPGEEEMFEAWHLADPVDAWEIEKNRRVFCEQGKNNPLVSETTPDC